MVSLAGPIISIHSHRMSIYRHVPILPRPSPPFLPHLETESFLPAGAVTGKTPERDQRCCHSRAWHGQQRHYQDRRRCPDTACTLCICDGGNHTAEARKTTQAPGAKNGMVLSQYAPVAVVFFLTRDDKKTNTLVLRIPSCWGISANFSMTR